MRPHLLELEAFTAFPGRVSLDLDDLAHSGLLLLCGDTGGGKTALLDALGFALYGVVPGERAKARDDLRSHHARPGVHAWVRLQFTARGRRLRITRRPAQTRPKARGPGTVTDQPTALLEQRDGDGWRPVAQRLDEVGLEVGRLLGMDAAQFFQVVMLPQGRFAAFLQADHREREKLLKQLFHVDRFERVESWLAQRAAEAGRQLAAARDVLGQVAARVAQAADEQPPDPPEADPEWARRLAQTAWAVRRELDVAVRRLVAAREDAVRALQDAEGTAARQRARQLAEGELADVEREQPAMSLLDGELAAARRAAPVVRAAAEAAEAACRAQRADDEERRSREVVAGLGADAAADPAGLRRAGGRLRTEAGRLEGLGEVLARADEADRQAAAAHEAAHRSEREQEQLSHRVEVDLPTQRVAAAEHRHRARQAEQALPEVRVELQRLVQQAALAEQLAAMAAARPALIAEVERAAAAADTLRRAAEELRVQRIDAAATELAAALVDDTPCPVCGSLDHPDVTEVRADHVSREAERAAQDAAAAGLAAQVQAEGDLRLHESRLGDVRSRLVDLAEDLPAAAAARAGSAVNGVDPVALAGRVRELEAHRADLVRSVADLPAAEALEAALQTHAEQAGAQLARVRAEHAEALRRHGDAVAEGARLRARLRAELGLQEGDELDVAARQVQVAALALSVEQAADAASAAAAARHAAQDAARTARLLAQDAGLGDGAGAAAASRTDAWQHDAQERLRQHHTRSAGVRGRLASAELAVAVDPPAPVRERGEQLHRAVAEHEGALAREQVAAERARQLDQLVGDYEAACAVLPELHQQAAELQGLAELAAGRGSNRLSMPLSTFVLAARLEEVALAASRRLLRMSGGRYTLVHTDSGRDKRQRAGLGLQVEDGWTGRRRDTATLSGGETFMTALALALGLADVVTSEAGGQSIDALFVDEGFGTLDAGSLDQVMDVLDELRSGGRLVGVVSHVAELRQRIPAQVHVVKGTTGSTVLTA